MKYRLDRVTDQIWVTEGEGSIADAMGVRKAWVRGDARLIDLSRPCLGIVGSRAATQYGMTMAHAFGFDAADCGRYVISGGAYGIDAAAHRGALATGKYPVTIAVLARGVDGDYPVAHGSLFAEIASRPGSAVVSAYEPGTPPSRTRFLERNGHLARLCDALLVVEAASRSGSMNAARQASTSGVPVYAVPGPVTSVQSGGTHELIRQGAARIATTILDIDGAVPR